MCASISIHIFVTNILYFCLYEKTDSFLLKEGFMSIVSHKTIQSCSVLLNLQEYELQRAIIRF